MKARLTLGALGAAGMLWGAWLLSDDGFDKLRSTILWLVGVVVLHDAVLAPIIVVIGVVAARTLRRRSVAAVAFLIWGTLTMAVANVLSGVGGKPDMDSLLNRPYVSAWLVLSVGIIVAALAVTARTDGRNRADH
ncbi:MAG: hypothetical protein WAL70_02280 [Aeromicrobium sp.]